MDGKEGLARVLERDSNVFMVAEKDGAVVGFVLGSWDGARALIHKLSVTPGLQRLGIGSRLVDEAVSGFAGMGAPTVGVTAADGTRDNEEQDSTGFWKRVGFESIPARLMIKFDIQGDEESDDEAED